MSDGEPAAAPDPPGSTGKSRWSGNPIPDVGFIEPLGGHHDVTGFDPALEDVGGVEGRGQAPTGCRSL